MLSPAEFVVITVFLLLIFGVAAVIGIILLQARQPDPTPQGRPSGTPSPEPPVDVSDTGERSTTPTRDAGVEDDSLLQVVFDQIPDAVVVADGHGRRLFQNTAADRLKDTRDGGLLVDGTIRDLLARAVAGETVQEEIEVFGPPRRSFVVSARPLVGGEGSGAFVIAEDVTVRRRTDSVRRDFVANISHELKSPIAAMGLLADMINSETDPEVVDRLSSRMVHEAERVSNTIDDLLSLTGIEFGDDTTFDDVDVDLIVDEVMERVAPTAEAVGISVGSIPGFEGVVTCDRRQLVSALHNLVDNAIKYSPATGRVELEVGRSEVDDMIEFTVRDEGPGIPRRDQDRIFERFYRVDRARSRETGGTGLGLAIVRHVADNHGGDVRVESHEGVGSTFVLRVPRVPPGTLD